MEWRPQPSSSLDLLANASDFPASGPVLIITDCWCDTLRVRRDHASLIPAGARLPFLARGRCFGCGSYPYSALLYLG